MIYINSDEIIMDKSTAVAIGNFDGLHAGHRKLIEEVKQRALANNLTSVIFSFCQQPDTDLSEKPSIPVILSQNEKIYLLEQMGIDVFIEYSFTKEFPLNKPKEFIEEVLIKKLNGKTLVISEGDLNKIPIKNIELNIVSVPPVVYDKAEISSAIIRSLIVNKQFKQAAKCLARPYFVMGKVMTGKRIGRTIGFPTVNLIPQGNKLFPPDGVYLTKTCYKNFSHFSITNIGKNPTVLGEHKTVETYLFGFNETIYGEMIKVDFYEWLRGEIEFNSLEALQNQLNTDVENAKKYFCNFKGWTC